MRVIVTFVFGGTVYIKTVSSYPMFSTYLKRIKLVYGPFRQSNMHSTLDFCPGPARKKMNVPLREAKSGWKFV